MDTCAAVHRHVVVFVPLPARLADAVVDGEVDSEVEQQREGVGRRELVALVTPPVAPHAAAIDGALGQDHDRVEETTGNKRPRWQR